MSTTNSSTNINVPQSSNSIQLNPHDYVNKGINDITLEYFNLINPEQKKSIRTLFIGVGILIGADIFKSIIQNMIRENQKNINDFLISGLQLFSPYNIIYYFDHTKNNIFSIYNYCKYAFVKKKPNEIFVSNNNNILSFEINCDEIFSNNLIMLLENYKTNKNNYGLVDNISFNEEYDSILEINQSSTKINKNLFNIKITYKNDLVICINKISYEYNYNDNSIKYLNNNNLSFVDVFTKKYSQFEKIYKIAELLKSFEVKDGVIISKLSGNLPRSLLSIDANTNINYYILAEIYKIDKSINNINIIMTNLAILTNTLIYNWFKTSNKLITCNIKKKLSYCRSFGPDFYLDEQIHNEIRYLSMSSIENSINIDNLLICFDNLLKSSGEQNNQNNLPVQNTNDKNFKINFEIENKHNESRIELNNKLVNFIEYVSSISKKHKVNKKINIYTINIKTNKKIEKIDNLEYVKYFETKKKLMDENKDISTKEIIELIGKEPDKFICDEKINYEVEKKTINTKYCSFDNLYLRKQQDTMLFSLAERFLNDKKLMDELGIPNKLGVLLYGEPGCGKTTTIITLGSYLGRDVFYLNLKSIKTNGELKIIFDHVNSEHSGGGIIILEDIDAMTSIVMDRSKLNNPIDKINSNKNELVDSGEDSVSLEYLLNLLDGTLTFNDSVVVITTNHLEKLDPALYRPGRIDNLVKMQKCDHYQISRIFKRFIGRDINLDVLNKINEDKFTPAKIIFHLINWVKKREESDDVIMGDFLVSN